MFINEPRLSDFKQVLLREGIQAEFVGGVLVCNNLVAVRRVSVLSLCSLSILSVSSLQTSPTALIYKLHNNKLNVQCEKKVTLLQYSNSH